MKAKKSLLIATLSASTLLVAGCGGSGGGSVNSTPAPIAGFTTFQNVPANTSTTISGITQEGTVSVASSGALENVGSASTGTGSVTYQHDSSNVVTSLAVHGAQSSISLDASNSTSVNLTLNGQNVAAAVSNSTGSTQALWANPNALGWSYQSFGVWGTGLTAGSTGQYGAISVGSVTSGSAVPTSGSATFTGYAGGIYDSGGMAYRYASNATMTANFSSNNVAISTTNSVITPIGQGGVPVAVSYLNLSGTMNYSAGSANFSGTLTATGAFGASMSGTAQGTFYGPTAQEIGGTFVVGGGNNAVVGGFGGKH